MSSYIKRLLLIAAVIFYGGAMKQAFAVQTLYDYESDEALEKKIDDLAKLHFYSRHPGKSDEALLSVVIKGRFAMPGPATQPRHFFGLRVTFAKDDIVATEDYLGMYNGETKLLLIEDDPPFNQRSACSSALE